MTFRFATTDDINQLISLRLNMLVEENVKGCRDIETQLNSYFCQHINRDALVAIALDGDTIVATSMVIFQQFPPSFSANAGVRAYIDNVYTKKEYRRKGLSTTLIDMLVTKCKEQNVPYVWLWASRQGAPVYKKYGFNELADFTTMDLRP